MCFYTFIIINKRRKIEEAFNIAKNKTGLPEE